jgi:PKHD-type hydroxylase
VRKNTKTAAVNKKEEEYHNSVWAFKVDQTHGWAFANNVFSEVECQKIIEIGEKKCLEPALVGDDKVADKKIRKSKTSWIFPSEETNWIYYRMSGIVNNLNDNYFNFNLFGFTEGFQFTKYEAPGAHYSSHIDKMFGKTVRKLSVVVQLSDPKDYQGGDLELCFGGTPDVMEKAQGRITAFPSYVLHQVKPVTKGIRYSLVAWVTGEPFK